MRPPLLVKWILFATVVAVAVAVSAAMCFPAFDNTAVATTDSAVPVAVAADAAVAAPDSAALIARVQSDKLVHKGGSAPTDNSGAGVSAHVHEEVAALRLQLKKLRHATKKHETEPLTALEYYSIVAGILVLVVLGGIVAGLTIGLMSLDETNLSILKASGTPTEKAYAERIAPIRRNAHLLLVTLLLANTVVNETLPIMLDAIHFEGWQAVLCSTVLIVIFGEIIPQAVCTRYGLQIGAFFAWPVRILIFCLWIVAYPVARLLDAALGHKDGVIYRRAELRELVALHGEDQAGPLTRDEVSVLRAVLELRDKSVANVMTVIDDVFMLPLSTSLDMPTLHSIMQAGHSRIPVHDDVDRQKVIGVVLVKQLIIYDPEDAVPLASVKIRRLPRVLAHTPLFEMLHIFEEGGSHMALVVEEFPREDDAEGTSTPPATAPPLSSAPPVTVTSTAIDATSPIPPARLFGPHVITNNNHNNNDATTARSALTSPDHLGVASSPFMSRTLSMTGNRHGIYRAIGIVTLEDVLEELLGEEIIDETDVYIDMATKVKVAHAIRDRPDLRSHMMVSPRLDASMPQQVGTASNTTATSSIAASNLAVFSPENANNDDLSEAEAERRPLLGGHSKTSRVTSPQSAPVQGGRLRMLLNKLDGGQISSTSIDPTPIQLPSAATDVSTQQHHQNQGQELNPASNIARVLDLSSLAPVPSHKYIKARRRREKEELPAGDLASRLENSPELVYLPTRPSFLSRTSTNLDEDALPNAAIANTVSAHGGVSSSPRRQHALSRSISITDNPINISVISPAANETILNRGLQPSVLFADGSAEHDTTSIDSDLPVPDHEPHAVNDTAIIHINHNDN